ncbi:hypothetical protein GLP59_15730 [Sulfitobacter sp. M220]|uniref:hypothetical protein n=1 Tax=Sulfitobacter sp. M220 TaxID=2675333 RepID=UPI001F43C6F6|nr:hypothetical protein [Sulfitobacter sp. M220]MCF7779070.1 hypothetical protein [Sulfitobacter sp. M220]
MELRQIGGIGAPLTPQHHVQPIFCAAEQGKAIPHGGFFPMIQACTGEDVVDVTIDRERVRNFAKWH